MGKQTIVATLLCALHTTLSSAGPTHPSAPYAPYSVVCPIKPHARPATLLGVEELAYVIKRQAVADHALEQWVKKTLDIDECEFELPRVALALSGGGPKAGITTAGVVQALDSRDSSYGVSGLLQSMTYMSALSGGSLTLSGLMVNDFAKISDLKTNLYNVNYQNPFLLPLQNASEIKADINAKSDAGYRTSIVDAYGRAIAYDFIGGTNGGNGLTWSNITRLSSFKAHDAPYPIITLTDTDVEQGQCSPNFTGPIWEFAPYNFGSFDPSVHAFYPTKYLGTPSRSLGKSKSLALCTEGFDNAGFFTGISSDTFVGPANCTPNGTEQLTGLGNVIYTAFSPAEFEQNPFGIVPNPFFGDKKAGRVNARKDLYMQDGGSTGQVIPLFPFLQAQREVDVIFAIDAESSTNNITNGQSLYDTYTAAHAMGLAKMPVVPDVQTYAAQNLSSRAQFFGCNDTAAATIIFIPNTYETEYSGSTYFFTPAGIETVFDGGLEMATQANDADWPVCVACGILHKKMSSLPDSCKLCLEKYCWSG